MEDADDAGRALVARALQVETLDQLLVGGEAGDRHRQGVGDLGDQRSEGDHHLHPDPLGGAGDQLGEGSPAKVRLGAVEEDEVVLGCLRPGDEEGVLGPVDLPRLPLAQGDRRPVRLEVEELLGVDGRKHFRVEGGGDRIQGAGGGAGGIVPPPKGADKNRGAELRRLHVPYQRLHDLSVDDAPRGDAGTGEPPLSPPRPAGAAGAFAPSDGASRPAGARGPPATGGWHGGAWERTAPQPTWPAAGGAPTRGCASGCARPAPRRGPWGPPRS